MVGTTNHSAYNNVIIIIINTTQSITGFNVLLVQGYDDDDNGDVDADDDADKKLVVDFLH